MLSTWSDFINYTCGVLSQCVLLSTTYTNCEISNMPNLYACCPHTGTHLVKPKCTNILHKMLILNVSKFKLYMVTVNTQYVSHQCFLGQKFISALCLQYIYINYTRDWYIYSTIGVNSSPAIYSYCTYHECLWFPDA